MPPKCRKVIVQSKNVNHWAAGLLADAYAPS